MNIAVCIKHVPVSNDVSVDPVTHTLVRESAEGMVNPADLNALEAAMVLREQAGGKVTVFTMGPPDAEKSLRHALSMGADEAVLLTDRCFAGGDTAATARVLAAALRRDGPYDLILAGSESADGATGQVGPMVAECLGIPHVAEARSVSYRDGQPHIEAVKRVQGGRVRLSATLPALLTLGYGCNEPRLPTLRSQMAAKKKPLTVCTNAELALLPGIIGLEGSPTRVTDSFQPENRRTAAFLTGSPAEVARQMVERIEKEKGNG